MGTICTALVRLVFSNDEVQAVTIEYGIDSIEELRYLNDTKVEKICKVVCRPGGGTNGAAAVGDSVSLGSENSLKLDCFWIRYQERVRRKQRAADITLMNIIVINDLCDVEKVHMDTMDGNYRVINLVSPR